MTEPTEVLRVSDVHVEFVDRKQRVKAVDGVDLVVNEREVVALVGESGCGKTTLLRAIIGLETASAGSVSLDGELVFEGGGASRRRFTALRRRVQMVFQYPTGALNPRHTVEDAVTEGLVIHKVDGDHRTLAIDALSRAGLRPPERFLERYPHEISGGQRQRVLIAGAIALDPRLLLADEPVASLDASIRGEILALLRSLVDDHGLSIVVVTHDLGLAWNIADRIAVMYLGRIVEEGPTEELLDAPLHPYTRALLSVVPESRALDQEILEGETPDATRIPSGCRFHPRCPLVASGEAERLGVLDRCLGTDVALVTVGRRAVACHAVSS